MKHHTTALYSPSNTTSVTDHSTVLMTTSALQQQQTADIQHTSSAPGQTCTDQMEQQQTVVSSPSSLDTYSQHSVSTSSNQQSSDSHSAASVDSAKYYNYLLTDNFQLKTTVETQQTQLAQLAEQMQQLHGHYTQLHAAYTQLSTTSDSQQPNVDNDAAQQQQTISILVQEKAEVQSQLRQAMTLANEKHVLNEELQGRLDCARERVEQLQRSHDSATGARSELEHTLSEQKLELDKRRHESATWEAKVVGLQQDKSELQARLKVKAREVDRLQADIGDSRKEMQMKEIYIRQLSAHAAGVSHANEQEDSVLKLHSELDSVRMELTASAANAELYKQEGAQARQQYEQYGRQLNQQLLLLSQQLEREAEQKLQVSSECERLKEELLHWQQATAQKEVYVGEDGEQQGDQVLCDDGTHALRCDEHDHIEHKQQVDRLAQELDVAKARAQEIGTRLEQSVASLAAAERRATMLDEQLSMHKQYSSDSGKLIEQVQSERSTVSRAVAQNRELKDQLIELQDQFVKMTNDNARLTEEQQSYEHRLKQIALDNSAGEEVLEQVNAVRQRLCDIVRVLQQHLAQTMPGQVQLSAEQCSLNSSQDCTSVQQALRAVCVSHAQLHSQQHALAQQMLEADALRGERHGLKQEAITLRATLDHHRTILAANTDQSPVRSEHNHSANEHCLNNNDDDAEDSGNQLQQRYDQLQRQLNDAVVTRNRFAAENSELHMIMQQNAEDENQNTIHVELQLAIDRITNLNTDNNHLRAQLQQLNDQCAARVSNEAANDNAQVNGHVNGTNGDTTKSNGAADCNGHAAVVNGNGSGNDDQSSLCSEHQDVKRDLVSDTSVDALRTAMTQLQHRFTRAMSQNADLTDHNQQLEHLITQLQHETDTVGEYITIYQHHRTVIRKRLKEKELSLAKLTREKDTVQEKLHSLQELVMQLLQEKGQLHSYSHSPNGTRHRSRGSSRSASPHGSITLPSTTTPNVHKHRTYSETHVDETSGDESVIVPAAPFADVASPIITNDDTQSMVDSPCSSTDGRRLDMLPEETGWEERVGSTTEQIVRLLTEMRTADSAQLSPMTHKCMHCNDCTGKLIVL